VTILDEILEYKIGEVARAKQRRPPEDLLAEARSLPTAPRGFESAIIERHREEGLAIIAEVKRRSPSKGLIRADFDPVEIARAYDKAGAACVSVLTDEHYFGGSLEYLEKIRVAIERPLLRKDFVVDAYQIAEARVAGADAILLIVAALEQAQLAELDEGARSLGLDVLVEVHDEAELERALEIGASLIGVNNRNLKTFEVDLGTTERLAARVRNESEVVLIAESGINDAGDIDRLAAAGARGFLVGESLMRQADPGAALVALKRIRGSFQEVPEKESRS